MFCTGKYLDDAETFGAISVDIPGARIAAILGIGTAQLAFPVLFLLRRGRCGIVSTRFQKLCSFYSRKRMAIIRTSKHSTKRPDPIGTANNRRPVSALSKISCPACGVKVREDMLNLHLDTECGSLSSSTAKENEHRPSNKHRFQPTLHEFFSGGVDTSIPGYFCFIFPQEARHRPKIQFRRHLPNQYRVIGTFNWPGAASLRPIQLCTNAHVMEDKSVSVDDLLIDLFHGSDPVYSSMPLLKSHLQKCIRRGEYDKATLTAWHMCRIPSSSNQARFQEHRSIVQSAFPQANMHKSPGLFGLSELLRRLPIIILEDVALHQEFGVLVWWMVYISRLASKNPLPLLSRDVWLWMRGWLLGMVRWVASCSTRDFYQGEAHIANELRVLGRFVDSLPSQPLTLQSKCLWTEMKDSDRDLLICLQLRSSYGGMGCDKIMLETFFTVWYNRMMVDYKRPDLRVLTPYSDPFPSVDFGETSEPLVNGQSRMALSGWELAAIDFHVSPVLRHLFDVTDVDTKMSLQRLYGSDPMSALKSLIWDQSSSVNNRKYITWNSVILDRSESDDAGKRIWSKLKPEFEAFASRHLKRFC